MMMSTKTDEIWEDFGVSDIEVQERVDRVFGNYHLFITALVADTKDADNLLRADDTGFTRRTYLRSFFSFVEGALFARRTIIYEFAKDDIETPLPNRLSDAEFMLLQEVEYVIDDNGSVGIRYQNFQPFLKFFRFTFSVVSKYWQKPNPVDYSGSGWASFRIAHQVRNRITHPKCPEDLEISDSELDHIKDARKWFVASFNSV